VNAEKTLVGLLSRRTGGSEFYIECVHFLLSRFLTKEVSVVANARHVEKLKEGVTAWNGWVKSSRERPDLRNADLRGFNLGSYYLKEGRLRGARLNGANLRKAKLNNAFLRRADLTGADLSEASLAGANLRHALLREANLSNAYLRRADLSYVDLRGADLSNSVLEYARFVDVNLENATLKDCRVYGASVWNLVGTPKEQSNLVITPIVTKRDFSSLPRELQDLHNQLTITVDDLETAQFIYLLLNHQKLRGAINAVTERGVLLLGRFGEGGLSLLRAVGTKLRETGYLPIIFDFDRPHDRNYTETVKTLVGLARFVIVDLSGPSVPQELYATVPHFKIPFVPIMERGRHPYAMFVDLLEYAWVHKPIVEFSDIAELLELLPGRVIAPAEAILNKRQRLLAELFGK
jgi:uncharacterized protein YjbI with pentapeptide repeats